MRFAFKLRRSMTGSVGLLAIRRPSVESHGDIFRHYNVRRPSDEGERG
jgi:hypothetical protein